MKDGGKYPRLAGASAVTRSFTVTSCADALDHEVTLTAMDAIVSEGGLPSAVCGELVVPAPLGTPPARRCRACALRLNEGLAHRQSRITAWFSGWFARDRS